MRIIAKIEMMLIIASFGIINLKMNNENNLKN